jgi:hypothetical protein
MNNKLRRFIFWDFSRETSIYVIFCLLIVAFIFFTPKSWFDRREKLATRGSHLVVKQSDYSPEKKVFEARVRELTGDPQAEIVGVKERRIDGGELVYDVEIR